LRQSLAIWCAYRARVVATGLQPFGSKKRGQSKFAGLWRAEKKFKLVNFDDFVKYTSHVRVFQTLDNFS